MLRAIQNVQTALQPDNPDRDRTEFAVKAETHEGKVMTLRRGFPSREAAENRRVQLSLWKRVWVKAAPAQSRATKLVAANPATGTPSGNDADPIFALIESHRRQYAINIKSMERLDRLQSCQGAHTEMTEWARRKVDTQADAEIAAFNAVLVCPATTIDGVRAALRHVSELLLAGWQLPDGASEAEFIASCAHALERINNGRTH